MLLALQIETEATRQRTQVMAEKTKKWILFPASGLFYCHLDCDTEITLKLWLLEL